MERTNDEKSETTTAAVNRLKRSVIKILCAILLLRSTLVNMHANTPVPTSIDDRNLSANSTIVDKDNAKANVKAKNVFVCVTGQLSRLELQNKVQQLFLPLKKAGYSLDVYLVIDSSARHFTNEMDRNGRITANFNHTEQAFADFQEAVDYLRLYNITTPTTHATPEPLEPVFNIHYRNGLQQKPNVNSTERTMNHARIFTTYKECGRHYKNSSTRYDFGIRMREDVGFVGPWNVSSLQALLDNHNNKTVFSSDCRTWSGMNDRLAVVSSAALEQYFDAPLDFLKIFKKPIPLYTELYEYSLIRKNRKITPEVFIYWAFREHAKLNVVLTDQIRGVVKMTGSPDGGTSKFVPNDLKWDKCPHNE